jgi:hypothetical protein
MKIRLTQKSTCSAGHARTQHFTHMMRSHSQHRRSESRCSDNGLAFCLWLPFSVVPPVIAEQMRLYMTSPDALRGLKLYVLHQHWGKNYADVLRYLDLAVAAGDAVLVSDHTDQSAYRSWGWLSFEVMETEDRLTFY